MGIDKDVIKILKYKTDYMKGAPQPKSMTATEAILWSTPCSSPLGLYTFYKTFKIFGIIIHFPAFWRKRKIKGKFFYDGEFLKD